MADCSTRTIKLYYPSISKIVAYVAREEHKLDLGAIARIVGLEQSSVKINGHFLSRGVDFVSSVTWRSLLSFFSAKGFSTGKDDGDAIVIDGKLCKSGAKRASDGLDDVNVVHHYINEDEDARVIRKSMPKVTSLVRNKRLKGSNSGCEYRDIGVLKRNGFGCKREHPCEDIKLLKKLKIDDSDSDIKGQGSDELPTKCTYMKRMRENEAIVAAPCKKCR